MMNEIMNEMNVEILGHILESESDLSSDEEDFDEIVPEPPVLFAANNGKKQ